MKTMEQPVLQLRHVEVGFGAAPVLKDVSADCAAGVTLVLGDEGAGKTTLLRLVAGELRASRGQLLWQGQEALPPVFWRDPRTPWPEVTPPAWAAEERTRWPHWSDAAWQQHLVGLGLAEHLDKTMEKLSTGSQRKVLIAAALASGAPLTLLDLPEAALDRTSIRYLRDALAEEVQAAGRVWLVALYEAWPGAQWHRLELDPPSE